MKVHIVFMVLCCLFLLAYAREQKKKVVKSGRNNNQRQFNAERMIFRGMNFNKQPCPYAGERRDQNGICYKPNKIAFH